MTLLRTCIGCRERRPQGELVRVTLGPEASVRLGRTLPGRGAWLCRGSLECFDAAVRRRAFAKALKADVDPLAFEQLRTDFALPGPAARD